MGKKEKVKSVTIYCENNHKLWKYRKVGGGRLQKCYIDEIGRNYTREDFSKLSLNDIVYCTECEPALAVGVVHLIHGRMAIEVDKSNTRKLRT